MSRSPQQVREDIQAIAREYHRMQQEHKREGVEGSWRRRLEEEMQTLQHKFDSLMVRFVHEPAAREQWDTYLRHGGEAPGLPELPAPLLFRGQSETGSILEIQEHHGEQAFFVDGALATRRAERFVLHEGTSPPTLHFHAQDFVECFDASDDAKQALLRYVDDPGNGPEWRVAPELVRDGLIDPTFALTDRGRRFVASSARGG